METIRICAMSDMHGKLESNVKPCDLVLICGDIVPLALQRRTNECLEWLCESFVNWCNTLPCDKVVVIAGNHDFALESNGEFFKKKLNEQDKIVYLNCETYEYKGIVIYGTPLCKTFGRWAFMSSPIDQEAFYRHEMRGKKIDILMSHDSPYGASDILLQKDCVWADGSHIGNKALNALIEETKPALMVHGHLHSTNHEMEKIGDCEVYCVSTLNEDYERAYEPLYLDFNKN